MTYQEIKKKRQYDYDKLLKDLGVFWAFSNEQFEKGKTPLAEGEKYVSIGMGGFIGKNSVDAMIEGMDKIEKTFKSEIKEFRMREKHILYELNNHECFYVGYPDGAMEALGDDYTLEEVSAVFKKYKAKKYTRPAKESDYVTANN